MPLDKNGNYHEIAEYRGYEKAITYQMQYFVSTALISLELIFNPNENQIKMHPDICQYYRYYLDHLFYVLGQINEHLIYKNFKGNQQVKQIKNEIIELNRMNYRFDEDKYKILSNKHSRNIIEHIDERNMLKIKERKAVGGFNVIFNDSNPKMINSLINNREFYPYTLDLVEHKVLFYDVQKEPKQFEVDLFELKKELESLKTNVDDFSERIEAIKWIY